MSISALSTFYFCEKDTFKKKMFFSRYSDVRTKIYIVYTRTQEFDIL